MDTPENTQIGEGTDLETQETPCCQLALVKSSAEEIQEAYETLRELVCRYKGRVAISLILKESDGTSCRYDCTDETAVVDKDSFTGLRWIAATGFFKKALSCMNNNASSKTIGKGIIYHAKDNKTRNSKKKLKDNPLGFLGQLFSND